MPYARERFYKGADFDDFTHVRARGAEMVPGGGRNAHPRHHAEETPGGLPG